MRYPNGDAIIIMVGFVLAVAACIGVMWLVGPFGG
jgi:hypothetical protein